MWENLIKKIEEILKANDKIAEVYSYESEIFKGSPAVSITPSSNESDYKTTNDNERIYAFNIRIFVNRSVAPAGQKVEYHSDRVLRTLVDSILDDFDKNYNLSGIEQPTGYCFINMFASPSSWGYAGREDEYRACEIILRCRVYVDVNSIS